MSKEFSRRRVLQATSAAAAGLGIVGTSPASEGTPSEDAMNARRAPCLDLTDVEMQTRPVDQYGVPERADDVRPGSQMYIEFPDGTTAGCTANFVWGDVLGNGNAAEEAGDLYIGAAGHCFLPTDKSASRRAASSEEKRNGDAYDVSQLDVSVCADCTFGGLTGLSVVQGRVVELGEVVYARQVERNGSDGPGHDFGLVRIPSDTHDLVDPSLPQWGGPNEVSPGALAAGTPINQYGAGVANGEVYPTMGSSGASMGGNADGDTWYAGIRASPGDSGSSIIGAEGTGKPAAGILTHLTTAGVAGTTIRKCRSMVERDVSLEVDVVLP